MPLHGENRNTIGSGDIPAPSGILSSWCSCAEVLPAKQIKNTAAKLRTVGIDIVRLDGAVGAIMAPKGLEPALLE